MSTLQGDGKEFVAYPGNFTSTSTPFGPPLPLVITSAVDNDGIKVPTWARDGPNVSIYSPGELAPCAFKTGVKDYIMQHRGSSDGKSTRFEKRLLLGNEMGKYWTTNSIALQPQLALLV